MRKNNLLFLFAFSLLSVPSFAQFNGALEKVSDNTRKTIVFIHPFSFFVGGFDVGMEKMLFDKSSLRISAGYYVSEDANAYATDNARKMEGFKVELQNRYYLAQDDGFLSGLYASPYLLYKQISLQKRTFDFDPLSSNQQFRTHNASAGGFGVVMGGQMISISRITLDIYFGGGMILPINDSGSDEVHIPLVNPYKKSILFRTGATLGVAF